MCDFEFDLHRTKLYEQVADRIQALIVREELGAGEKLPGERELAEALGVCRTVVREAIRALEVRGLVLVKPGCGTYIRAYDAADAATPVTLYLRLLGEGASTEAVEIARQSNNEQLRIPEDFDYSQVRGLSFEVRQKLTQQRPETIGQAARISGVTPAAISLLLVHLKKRRQHSADVRAA